MTVYASANEPGLYFVGVPDEDDIFVDALHEVYFPALARYATDNNVSGYIWLDLEYNGEYYTPVIPK